MMPFYFDDGTEFNPALYPKPDLCIAFAVNDNPQGEDDMLCTLTRLDQHDTDEFECHVFEPRQAER
jgi:hypothetical protein